MEEYSVFVGIRVAGTSFSPYTLGGPAMGRAIVGTISMVIKICLETGKATEARDEMVNDVNSQILCDVVEVRRRWVSILSRS